MITQYATEQRKPPLSRDPLRYELRMVDDDGEPDSDIPALDRTRELHKFGVDELALCTCPSFFTAWHSLGVLICAVCSLGITGENPKFVGHRDSDATATFELLNSQRFLDKKFIKVHCVRFSVCATPRLGACAYCGIQTGTLLSITSALPGVHGRSFIHRTSGTEYVGVRHSSHSGQEEERTYHLLTSACSVAFSNSPVALRSAPQVDDEEMSQSRYMFFHKRDEVRNSVYEQIANHEVFVLSLPILLALCSSDKHGRRAAQLEHTTGADRWRRVCGTRRVGACAPHFRRGDVESIPL